MPLDAGREFPLADPTTDAASPTMRGQHVILAAVVTAAAAASFSE